MNDQQKPSRGKTVHTFVFVLAMVVLVSIISYAALTFWAMHLLSEDNATMSTAMTVGGIVTGFVLFAQSALGKYFDMTVKLLNIAPDASSVTTTTTTVPPKDEPPVSAKDAQPAVLTPPPPADKVAT